jgi:hypothetical protein
MNAVVITALGAKPGRPRVEIFRGESQKTEIDVLTMTSSIGELFDNEGKANSKALCRAGEVIATIRALCPGLEPTALALLDLIERGMNVKNAPHVYSLMLLGVKRIGGNPRLEAELREMVLQRGWVVGVVNKDHRVVIVRGNTQTVYQPSCKFPKGTHIFVPRPLAGQPPRGCVGDKALTAMGYRFIPGRGFEKFVAITNLAVPLLGS